MKGDEVKIEVDHESQLLPASEDNANIVCFVYIFPLVMMLVD